MPFFDKNYPVALVTGSSRGIGLAIANRLVADKWNVIGVSRQESVADLAQTGSYKHLQIDLAVPERLNYLREVIAEQDTNMRALVNCAGIITREDTMHHGLAAWSHVLAVNLSAAYEVSRMVLPRLVQSGSGAIVNIASQMAHMPHPGASASYEVSKAGLVALTRHLAAEFGPKGVRVNSISPGSISTGLQKDMDVKVWREIQDRIPLRRLGEPDEVANVVEMLLSDAGSYINGADIQVNGGSLMR